MAVYAHFLHEAGRGMRQPVEALKAWGITEAYYLKERKVYAYPI